MRLIIPGLLILSLLLPSCTKKSPVDCGSVPVPNFQLSDEQNVKANLQAEASFLSNLVDTGKLQTNIEASRKKIYQDADKVRASWKDAYLSHMFCSLVANSNMSDSEKISALKSFQDPPKLPDPPIQPPPKTAFETRICFGEGGTPHGDCHSGANVNLSCGRYRDYGDHMDTSLMAEYCTNIGGSNTRISEYFNQSGGNCGWTGKTVYCEK